MSLIFAWNQFGFVGLSVFCLCFVSSDQTCKVDLSKKADSSDARLPPCAVEMYTYLV